MASGTVRFMVRSPRPPAAGGAVPLQWPLVGRHEEVELFESTLDDPRAHGFVVHGPAGVGKTRLADECLSVARARGRAVARASAGEGTQSAPLGALAHLLPPGLADQRFDVVAVLDGVAPVLREQGANGPLVLFVDDLHRLDATSAILLAQLVDADLVFLVATARAGETVPPPLAALWQRARVRRVDLLELDQPGVDSLLHLVLRGPVAPGTIASLWGACRGNILFLRELVLGALEGGRLVEQHGVWQLTGPPPTTPPMVDLMEARFGELDADERAALDVLAVWEPTGLAMVESCVDIAVLERLDGLGLLATRTEDRRRQVALAHPLYGEILRARLSTLAYRRLLLAHADEIERRGARRREDPIRIAVARVDAAAPADGALLIEAARLARWGHDFAQVARLARASMLNCESAEAALLLGEALHELGAYEEANVVLSDAEAGLAADDPLFAMVAEQRALNLLWGLHRHDEALAANRAARDRATDAETIDEFDRWEAVLLNFSGRPRDALAKLDGLGESDRPRARTLHAVAEVPALVSTGRSETAARLARAAFAEHSQLPPQMAIAEPGLHVIYEIHADTESGALLEGHELAQRVYEFMEATAPPAGGMWITYLLGRSALLMGKPATARRWLGEAVARCEEFDYAGPRRLALSLLANAHALLGDAPAAAAAAADIDRAPPLAYSRAEQEFGRAWALVVAGDVAGARGVLRAAADLAAAGGYLGTEAWTLHDLARLGDASGADRLAELAVECEGPLVAAYAAHARACAGQRAEPFLAAADGFEAIGAALFAAEAANGAARAFQRQGDQRAASAAAARVGRLAAGLEGARTPALATTEAFVPLTTREHEIAALAARGIPAKDIASRLFLSARTVNNHLQRVYSKLGISGRSELADALGDAPPGEGLPPA